MLHEWIEYFHRLKTSENTAHKLNILPYYTLSHVLPDIRIIIMFQSVWVKNSICAIVFRYSRGILLNSLATTPNYCRYSCDH